MYKKTFAVPLTDYLSVNHDIYNDRMVIIKPSDSQSIYLKDCSFCDGEYVNNHGEKVSMYRSDVIGYDAQGKLHQSSIIGSVILLPIEMLKD